MKQPNNSFHEFIKASSIIFGAYEMRYWAVFAFAVIVADMFGVVSQSAAVVAIIALALAGWLVGVRLNREGFAIERRGVE